MFDFDNFLISISENLTEWIVHFWKKWTKRHPFLQDIQEIILGVFSVIAFFRRLKMAWFFFSKSSSPPASHRLFKSLNSWVTFQVVWCHLACQSRTSTTFCVSRWESDFQNSSLIFSCNSKPLVCVRSMRRSLIRGGNFSPKQFDTKSVLDNCILSPYNAKKGRNERRPPRHPLKVLYYRH